ncbi:hypothetical protein D3C85_869720 [compost metagenome]
MENSYEIIQVTKTLICCKESFYFGQKTFPIVVEISKRVKSFKVDLNDPNFFKPYSELEKNYQQLN